MDNKSSRFEIKGTVKGKENFAPISGVEISTSSGRYTKTNAFGEFKIEASVGEMLIVESPEFETVRHRIKSDEDIDVRVAGYKGYGTAKKRKTVKFQKYCESPEIAGFCRFL